MIGLHVCAPCPARLNKLQISVFISVSEIEGSQITWPKQGEWKMEESAHLSPVLCSFRSLLYFVYLFVFQDQGHLVFLDIVLSLVHAWCQWSLPPGSHTHYSSRLTKDLSLWSIASTKMVIISCVSFLSTLWWPMPLTAPPEVQRQEELWEDSLVCALSSRAARICREALSQTAIGHLKLLP